MLPQLKGCRVELHTGKESSHKEISVSNIIVKINPNMVELVFHSAVKSELFSLLNLKFTTKPFVLMFGQFQNFRCEFTHVLMLQIQHHVL